MNTLADAPSSLGRCLHVQQAKAIKLRHSCCLVHLIFIFNFRACFLPEKKKCILQALQPQDKSLYPRANIQKTSAHVNHLKSVGQKWFHFHK